MRVAGMVITIESATKAMSAACMSISGSETRYDVSFTGFIIGLIVKGGAL